MDVRLLEAFRAVVDYRSMTGATAAIGVTQPALSAQIPRLEQDPIVCGLVGTGAGWSVVDSLSARTFASGVKDPHLRSRYPLRDRELSCARERALDLPSRFWRC
jgi:hypothetical protein